MRFPATHLLAKLSSVLMTSLYIYNNLLSYSARNLLAKLSS